jgi:hypothetical protein
MLSKSLLLLAAAAVSHAGTPAGFNPGSKETLYVAYGLAPPVVAFEGTVLARNGEFVRSQ